MTNYDEYAARIAEVLVSFNDRDLTDLMGASAIVRDERARPSTSTTAEGTHDRLWSTVGAMIADLAAGERDKRAGDWPAIQEDIDPSPFGVVGVELPGRDDAL